MMTSAEQANSEHCSTTMHCVSKIYHVTHVYKFFQGFIYGVGWEEASPPNCSASPTPEILKCIQQEWEKCLRLIVCTYILN